MKILVLANKVPFPPKDGGAIATQSIIAGLANNGAQVTVLAISTPKHCTSIGDLPQWLTNIAKFYIVPVNTDLNPTKALFNLLFSKKPYNTQRFVNTEVTEQLENLLKNNPFDLIQLEGLYMAPYIATVRKYSSAPIALRAHNVEYEIWERSARIETNFLKKWYLNNLAKRVKRMETQCLRSIDLLVAISKRDEEILLRMGFNGPSTTSQTGLDAEQFLPCKQLSHSNSIFHLGGLDWLPNQEGLLWFVNKCWNRVLSSQANAKFYVAGRNAPASFIDEITKFPNVEFCGEVPNSQEFICSKGIMVVPLLSGSGMRIKIVEGMFLGKAIVSTSIGAEGIEVENGKHMLIANDPEDFTKQIIECLTNHNLAANLGTNARYFALAHFDNSSICEQLLHFYRLACAK